jgi:hypothetical protein
MEADLLPDPEIGMHHTTEKDAYLGGNKHGIGKFFASVCENVSPLLNPRIDRSTSTALTGLLRKLNFCRSNQDSRGQRNKHRRLPCRK